MKEDFKVTVTTADDGRIMRDFLRGALNFSSSLITKVKFGGVKLNGEVVTMRAHLHEGDTVEITFPEEASEGIEPIRAPLDILFEDDDILIVNKPKNMPVHPSRGNHLTTLANIVAAYFDRPFVFRAINRLDRDTSGIVIIAKTAYSSARLYSDMKAGKFEKYYTALLSKAPKETEGLIDAPIEREEEGSMRRVVRADGKAARTSYKITSVLPDGRAIAEIRLYTGRTHQIRVHMAHIGCPLYGDFLYGERSEEGYSLHCTRIVFPHPHTGERIDINSKPEIKF